MTTAGAVNTAISYDSASRPQVIGLDPSGASYDVAHTLGYNPAGQIVNDTLSNSNFEHFENRSSAGAYAANGLNEYTQVGSQSYAYDDNGNLTSDGATTYTYDAENRLINTVGAKNATLKYDPFGHLYQITGDTTTNFLYSGDSLVAEYRNGAMTKRYVFGAGVDKPLVMYDGATVTSANRQFIHGNHQGSVIAITDSAGNVVATNTYDAFGVPSAYNQGRFAYTGQAYLDEIGMYYYKARVYYPQIGRFLQTDPVGYKDDMNMYAYVGNDPLNKTDPTGMFQLTGCREVSDSYLCGGSSSDDDGNQKKADMVAGAEVGGAVGAAADVAISGGCDVATSGVCAPANPEIVAVSAAAGAAIGAKLGPPVMASSRILAKNIAAATGNTKKKSEESHHIVAENEPQAANSRKILANVGMSIDSAFNGMNMNWRYHRRVHTDLYYQSVENALTGSTSYADVAARLSVIRIKIYLGTFPF